MEGLPDDAVLVRGGRNRIEAIEWAMATHPSGVTGISVESAAGGSVRELSAPIPHGQVGVTTVGKVRRKGGEVIQTSGRSPNHATLTGLSSQQIHQLLTPTVPNPAHVDPNPGRD